MLFDIVVEKVLKSDFPPKLFKFIWHARTLCEPIITSSTRSTSQGILSLGGFGLGYARIHLSVLEARMKARLS